MQWSSHATQHHHGPTRKSIAKTALMAWAGIAGAGAQNMPFLGGTYVPNTGTPRGGPLPLAPAQLPNAAPPVALPRAFGPGAAWPALGVPTSAVGESLPAVALKPSPGQPTGRGRPRHLNRDTARSAQLSGLADISAIDHTQLASDLVTGDLAGGGTAGHHMSADTVRHLRAGTAVSHSGRRLTATTSLGLLSQQVYGCTLSDYSAQVTVGQQPMYAIIDSGSASLFVASDLCQNCNVSTDYTLTSSAIDLDLTLLLNYNLGNVSGEEVQDSVSLGQGPQVDLVFLDVLQAKQQLTPNNCVYGELLPSNNEGLLGMGPAALLRGQTQSYFLSVAPSLLNPAYSVAFCDVNGALYLGGYPTAKVTQAPFFTPMATPEESDYVAVGMLSLRVGQNDIGATLQDFGYALVDTGTSALWFPTPVYQTIVANLAKATQNELGAEFFSGRKCIKLPTGTTRAQINAGAPSLTMGFYNPQSDSEIYTMTVDATNSYLNVKYDSRNQSYICPFLVDSGAASQTILGNTVMRNFMFVFDIGNSQVGIAPSKGVCSN